MGKPVHCSTVDSCYLLLILCLVYALPLQVISILGKTLAPFDKDGLIPAFGFGDSVTEDKRVFPFKEDESYCNGFEEVLSIYNQVVPKVDLGGPTDFAPLIREAIRIVEKSGEVSEIKKERKKTVEMIEKRC